MIKMNNLSIIITSFNNSAYIKDVIDRVRVNFPKAEIIIIDDCSTDGSDEILEDLDYSPNTIVLWNIFNKGYGFSLKRGMRLSRRKYIAFQDSDLEYEPADIKKLYNVAKSGKEYSDIYLYSNLVSFHLLPKHKREVNYARDTERTIVIAYGRRTHYGIRNPLAWLGRTIVNGLFYVMYGFKIRDVCTAYKVMPRQLLLDLDIRANDFRFSIELGAKLILGGYKVVEIPIDYYPRTTQEGKSIRWVDGMNMIIAMLKWRVK